MLPVARPSNSAFVAVSSAVLVSSFFSPSMDDNNGIMRAVAGGAKRRGAAKRVASGTPASSAADDEAADSSPLAVRKQGAPAAQSQARKRSKTQLSLLVCGICQVTGAQVDWGTHGPMESTGAMGLPGCRDCFETWKMGWSHNKTWQLMCSMCRDGDAYKAEFMISRDVMTGMRAKDKQVLFVGCLVGAWRGFGAGDSCCWFVFWVCWDG